MTPLLLLAAVLNTSPVPEAYRAELPAPPKGWTREKAVLGKALFHEKRLSRDNTVSCATCHDPEKAFTDGRAISPGIGGLEGTRNSPTLVNRALGKHQFWDGRARTLEEQSLGPITNEREMALSVKEAVRRLRADPGYRGAFKKAFGGPPDERRLAEALAHYQRTLYSVDSPFDRFLAGDAQALSASAQRGLQLFGGKARCGECHAGINFSDEDFHVLGVGGPDEPGRGAVTKRPEDHGAFKTPTLREVARTAPYMHDGSFATLAEVVGLYDSGAVPHPRLSPRIQPLGLTAGEKADLVAFMEALSGRIVDVDSPPPAPVAGAPTP